MSVRAAALWSMGAQYVAFALHFAASVIIARFFLSPEEVGLFSIALSAAMMVSILQDFGITRYIAGEPNLSDAQIRTCYSVSILFALAVGLVILALAWPAARFYGDERLLPLLALVAASYLIVPFGIVPSALLQREMDFKSLFAVNCGAALAQAAVAVGLAAAGFSAMALAWGAIAQQAARGGIGIALSGARPRLPLSLEGAKPVLRFGSGASLLYVSGAIGTRSPELVIGRILSFAAVGLYSRAVGLAGQLRQLVVGAIAAVFYPAFARIRDSGGDLSAPYLRVVSGYSAVTWPAMAFLAAAATPLVLLLYGPVWAETAPLLALIALAEILFTALPLHVEMPILLGRMRTLLKLNVCDTVASLGLLLLGAWWSLEWAAASRIGYGLIWFAIYSGLMQSLIGFRWRDMLSLYLKSGIAAAATAAPLLLLYQVQSPAETGFAALAGAAAAGVLAWLAAIFILRHPVRHEVTGMLATLRAAAPRPLRFGRS
jgi:O-antigen/teichoic acid export membrane protein